MIEKNIFFCRKNSIIMWLILGFIIDILLIFLKFYRQYYYFMIILLVEIISFLRLRFLSKSMEVISTDILKDLMLLGTCTPLVLSLWFFCNVRYIRLLQANEYIFISIPAFVFLITPFCISFMFFWKYFKNNLTNVFF